jgi:hypothetical protein
MILASILTAQEDRGVSDRPDHRTLRVGDPRLRQTADAPDSINAIQGTSMNTKFAAWIVLLALILRSITPVFAVPVAQFVAASGNVSVSSPQHAPQPVSKGNGVENGMIVTTGNKSRAVLQFQDGQIIALQSNSVFRVIEYKFDRSSLEKSSIFFSLAKGGLRAVTGLIGDRRPMNWKLEMPVATAGIRGTDFLAVIYQGVYARVTSGEISLSNSAGTEIFPVGQTVYVGSAAAPGISIPYSLAPKGIFDELQAIDLSIVDGGAAPGAWGNTEPRTILGVSRSTAIAIGLGLGAAAVAAAAGGGGGTSTTTQH